MKVMGFAEPVIESATSGGARWLNPSYGYGIDAHAIIAAAETIAPGRTIRHLGVV
jgi:hypothetical protein